MKNKLIFIQRKDEQKFYQFNNQLKKHFLKIIARACAS